MFCLPCKLIVQVVLLPRSNTTTLVTGGLADDVLDDEAAIVASFLHYSTLSTVVYQKGFSSFLFCSSVGGSHSLLMCVGLFSSERGERGRKQLRRYRWPFLFLSSVETPTLVQANRFFFLFLFSFPFYHGLVLWARNHRFSVGSRTSVLKFKKMGPNCACEMNEPDATTNPREFEYMYMKI